MSRQSALDAARRLADQARRQGHEVQVLIQGVGGELSPVPLVGRPGNDVPDDGPGPQPQAPHGA